MDLRIGISGWRYEPWRQVFYPPKLAQRRELEYASRKVNSIEINGSFYSLQTPESYQTWHDETPDDFKFSVKGPKFITHIRRLKDVEKPLANFFGSGVLHLRNKFGPVLWQFAPSFRFEEERLSEFFDLLPRTVGEAIKLSKKADRVEPSYPTGDKNAPIRHAIEIRHASFENPDFIDLLRKNDVALVFADTAGTWPYMEDVTSDFVYLRLHGEEQLYASGYDDDAIAFWADRIGAWQHGGQSKDALTMSDTKPKKTKRDAFVYFDNDIKVYAPFDAQNLYGELTGKKEKLTRPEPKLARRLTQAAARKKWPS